MTIGQNIKRYRELAGLTQEQLAELMGVTQENISQMENDKLGITIQKAEQLAEALGIGLDELISKSN